MRSRKPRRRATIVRNGRRIEVCGTDAVAVARRHAVGMRAAAWIPSAALAFVVLLSVFALNRSPLQPELAQRRTPASAAYTIDDFVTAANR